jgi:hypothetical protein
MTGIVLPIILIAICVLSLWFGVDSSDRRPGSNGVVWRDVSDDFRE